VVDHQNVFLTGFIGSLQGQMGMEGLANVLGAYGQYNGAQFTPEQQASLLSSLGMQNVLGNNSLASQQMNPSQYGGLQPVDLSNSNNLVNNGAAGLGMAGLNDGMYGQGNLYGGRGVGAMGMPPARLNGQREGEMGNNMPSNGLNSMYGHAYGANGNSALYPGQYPGAMPRQQRMGSGGANEVSNQWKLFVGQLPPEVSHHHTPSCHSTIPNTFKNDLALWYWDAWHSNMHGHQFVLFSSAASLGFQVYAHCPSCTLCPLLICPGT